MTHEPVTELGFSRECKEAMSRKQKEIPSHGNAEKLCDPGVSDSFSRQRIEPRSAVSQKNGIL